MHGITHRQISATGGAALAALSAPATWPAAAAAGALVWMCTKTGSLPDTLERGVFRHHRSLRVLTVGAACGAVAAVGAPLLAPVVALWLEPFDHRTELHDPTITLPVLGLLTWTAALAGPLALVPMEAITIGWALHLAADACTPRGLPITWWKDDNGEARRVHLLPKNDRIPTKGRPGDPTNPEDPREIRVRKGARVLFGVLLLVASAAMFKAYWPQLQSGTAASARQCTAHAARRVAHARRHVVVALDRRPHRRRRATVYVPASNGHTRHVKLVCRGGRWHVRSG